MVTAPSASPAARRLTRGWWAVVIVAALALAPTILGIGVYANRFGIADWAARTWIRQHHLEGRIDIHELDLGHFSGSLRLGDKTGPAITVERLDVDYRIEAAQGGLGVRATKVTLLRPVLKAQLTRGVLDFGPLQPIIDQALKAPPTGRPPRVLVRQGVFDLATPGGLLSLRGDADVDHGELSRLQARLAATTLRTAAAMLQTAGGTVSARRDAGGRLLATAALDVTAASNAGASLAGGALRLDLAMDYPKPKEGRLDGVATATGRLTAAAGRTPEAAVRDLRLTLQAPGLRFAWSQGASRIAGAASVVVAAGHVVAANASAAAFTSTVQLADLLLVSGPAGAAVSARVAGGVNATGAELGGMLLTTASVTGSGPLQADAHGFRLNWDGLVAARSVQSAAQAERIAASAPLVSGEPAYRAALARALRDARLAPARFRAVVSGGGLSMTLPGPLALTASSGAKLLISPRGAAPLLVARGGHVVGGGRVVLSGGGLPSLTAEVVGASLQTGVARADVTLDAALDYGPAHGVRLQARAGLIAAADVQTIVLRACAPVSVARLESGEKDVTDVRVTLCPGAAPLLQARGGAWRMNAALREGAGVAGPAEARLDGVGGELQASGDGRGVRAGRLRLDAATLTDLAEPKRFEPMRARGEARLDGNEAQAGLDLATAGGTRVGHVEARHDLASGAGEATIEAPDLRFAKDGFQPTSLSPLAVGVTDLDGSVAFQGRSAWTRDGVVSSGRLRTQGLSLASPAGVVRGVSADVAFTSLAPLATPPQQQITFERINAVAPLTNGSARFQLSGDVLTLSAAEATLAKGRVSLDPMTLPLGRDFKASGVLTLKGVDFGELVATSSLADSVKLDAIIDGRLPFAYDAAGLRLTEGRLDAIRPGRISISRAALTNVQTGGGPTAPGEVNAVQDIAYQAMEDLAFDTLSAEVNSRSGGRLGILFQIKGRHDPAKPEEARLSLLDLLRGKAFNKHIPLPAGTPINLTLDTSLNFDELLKAFEDIWRAKQAPRSAVVQGP